MNNLYTYTVSGEFYTRERRGLSIVERAYQSIQDMLRYDCGTACMMSIKENQATWSISAARCTIGRWESFGYKVSKVLKSRVKDKEWRDFCEDARDDWRDV